jgi:hypothetical protein
LEGSEASVILTDESMKENDAENYGFENTAHTSSTQKIYSAKVSSAIGQRNKEHEFSDNDSCDGDIQQ